MQLLWAGNLQTVMHLSFGSGPFPQALIIITVTEVKYSCVQRITTKSSAVNIRVLKGILQTSAGCYIIYPSKKEDDASLTWIQPHNTCMSNAYIYLKQQFCLVLFSFLPIK